MKHKLYKRWFFVFILLLVLFYSIYKCDPYANHVDELDFINREEYKKSQRLTIKERVLIKRFISEGYMNVQIEKPFEGLDLPGQGVYNVKLNCPFQISSTNIDSLKQVFELKVLFMLDSVLEYSVHRNINRIDFQLYTLNYPSKKFWFRKVISVSV